MVGFGFYVKILESQYSSHINQITSKQLKFNQKKKINLFSKPFQLLTNNLTKYSSRDNFYSSEHEKLNGTI